MLLVEMSMDPLYEDGDDDDDTKPNKNGMECRDCGRFYKLKSSLFNHRKYECGKEPQFKCPICEYSAKQKGNFKEHMFRKHRKHYHKYRDQFGI